MASVLGLSSVVAQVLMVNRWLLTTCLRGRSKEVVNPVPLIVMEACTLTVAAIGTMAFSFRLEPICSII